MSQSVKKETESSAVNPKDRKAPAARQAAKKKEKFTVVDDQGVEEKDEEFLVKMILRPLKTTLEDDPNVAHRQANLPRKKRQQQSKKDAFRAKDTVTLTQMVKRKATSEKPGDSSESDGDSLSDDDDNDGDDSTSSNNDSESEQAGKSSTKRKKKNTNLFLSAYEGGNKQKVSLIKLLYETKPKYVILYDMQLWFVRQLEVFKGLHAALPMRVYVLMYMNSSEEQRFLTSIRTEKESFEILIRQKAVSSFIFINKNGQDT